MSGPEENFGLTPEQMDQMAATSADLQRAAPKIVKWLNDNLEGVISEDMGARVVDFGLLGPMFTMQIEVPRDRVMAFMSSRLGS